MRTKHHIGDTLKGMTSDRKRDLAILSNAPCEDVGFNDEEQAAFDREVERERIINRNVLPEGSDGTVRITPNKAQHSPGSLAVEAISNEFFLVKQQLQEHIEALKWTRDNEQILARQRNEAKAHADKLAEALRGLLEKFVTVESYPNPSKEISNKFINLATSETLARETLAAYEKESK